MGNTVTKLTDIPSGSAVLNGFGRVDYRDAYQIRVNTEDCAEQIARQVMKLPGWVSALFRLRNAIVRIFGLKTGGGVVVVFPTVYRSEDEVVTGLPDSHLDFRVSFFKDRAGGTVTMTTVVHYNNALGRLYFFFVRPFHKVIAKTLLKLYLSDKGA